MKTFRVIPATGEPFTVLAATFERPTDAKGWLVFCDAAGRELAVANVANVSAVGEESAFGEKASDNS